MHTRQGDVAGDVIEPMEIVAWASVALIVLLGVLVAARVVRALTRNLAPGASTPTVARTAGRTPLSLDQFFDTYYAGKDVSKTTCGQTLSMFAVMTGVSSELLRPEDSIRDFGPVRGMRGQATLLIGGELEAAVAQARGQPGGEALPPKLETLDDCIRAASVLERIHGKR